MSDSSSTFVLVATYPDEAAAQDDYQVIKDAHAQGVVGSYDAAVVTKDPSGNVHQNKDETATRKGAWSGACPPGRPSVSSSRHRSSPALRPGPQSAPSAGTSPRACRARTRNSSGTSFEPGQAALVVIGENKVEDAIKKAVAGAEKQTARDLDVDPKDIDKTLQQTVKEM